MSDETTSLNQVVASGDAQPLRLNASDRRFMGVTLPTDSTAILSALMHLEALVPSPTNPRTTFDEAGIAELAESIAQHEVLHAILARPRPGAALTEPLEIVAGERRWRACNLLTQQGRNPHGQRIPTTVRKLTDRQVLLIQLEENLRRRDLHPLEEAAHYQRMRSSPTAPMTLQEIADAAGCSPRYVSRMLTLCDLVPQAREAFQQGKLSRQTALQVARLPEAQQAEATEHLANWGGEPMGAKAAANFLRDRYMLRLAGAVFDVADAQLVPAAGPCTTCPKRTGANPQLFDDITDADLCTDGACFKGKAQAARDALLVKLKAEGYTMADPDRSRVLCTPDGRALRPGMHKLEDHVPHSLGEPSLTVVKVLEHAKAPPSSTTIVDHPSAPWLIYAVATADLERALRKIKSHRQQLDDAARVRASQGKAAAAAPAEPPAAAPAPAAPAGSALTGEAAWPYPGEPTLKSQAPVPPRTPEPSPVPKEVHEDLLGFHVPATVAGGYNGKTAAQFAAEQTWRIEAILIAHAAARAAADPVGAGLVMDANLARMIVTLGLYGECYLEWAMVAELVGVPYAGGNLQDQLQWAHTLEHGQAVRVALAVLALQPAHTMTVNAVTGFEPFRQWVADLMRVPTTDITDTAERLVATRMQVGAIQHGMDARPKAKRGAKAGKTPKAGKPGATAKDSDHE